MTNKEKSICEICGKEDKIFFIHSDYYHRDIEVCYDCLENGIPISALKHLQYETIDINNSKIEIIGSSTAKRLFNQDVSPYSIRSNMWKVIGKANKVLKSHNNNYKIHLIELTIKYGRPLKLKIWVKDIKNRKVFYGNGQNNVYHITALDNLFYYHFIDIEEF